jgi:hypothetical protein
MKPHLAILLLTLCLFAAPVAAQDTAATLKSAELDLSVPSSPAFAVLGLTPETVLRPSSPRALAAALLNGVDPNGTLQTGIAIDAAPYFLAQGPRIGLQRYRESAMIRFLSRLQLSAATAKAASEGDNAMRVSGGLKVAFWDRGDYRGNLQLQRALSNLRNAAMDQARREGLSPSPINEEQTLAFNARVDEVIARGARGVRDQFTANWNDSAFVAGVAGTWISESGTATTLATAGSAVWASLAYGFENVPGLENTAQLIVHGRYRTGDRVPKPGVQRELVTQSSGLGGVRLRVGAADTNLSFEGVYLDTEPDGLPRDRFLRLSGEAEHRVFENIWLQFAVGGESGRDDDRSHLFVLSTLKFSIADRRP